MAVKFGLGLPGYQRRIKQPRSPTPYKSRTTKESRGGCLENKDKKATTTLPRDATPEFDAIQQVPDIRKRYSLSSSLPASMH
jgi:hypothetical protein